MGTEADHVVATDEAGRHEARPAKLRVLLISHTCQSESEGQPKAVLLARTEGIELKVITPDRWKHYGQWRPADQNDLARAGNVCVEKVKLPWAGPAQFYLHWYPRLKNVLLEFRPDVIDLWEEPWGLVSVQVCRLRNRLLPRTKVVTETEQNVNKSLPFPFERFRRYTLANADWAVGRNAEAVEILRKKGYAGPAEVVPNAVDAVRFRPLDRMRCREELGVSGFVVGYVGRLVEEKGLMDLVEATARCGENVNLLLAGSGEFQGKLEERTRELGVAGRVRFMGACAAERLPVVMNAMDVLALPSRTTARWKEQFGRVIIEANACGVPVIGSDSGAIPDVVGKAGRVVPERNPEALAAAIQELAGDIQACRAMGAEGRAQVEAMYTWERVAERMARIYRQVANTARRTEAGSDLSVTV